VGSRGGSIRRVCLCQLSEMLSALGPVKSLLLLHEPLSKGCGGVRGSVVSMNACSLRVLLALFGVKMQQLLHRIPRLFRVSSPSEAVAKIPRMVVKLRPLPLQALDRTTAKNKEVLFTIAWHPSSLFSWYLRFSSWHECRSTTFFKAWV
jgi:hypothetical protein